MSTITPHQLRNKAIFYAYYTLCLLITILKLIGQKRKFEFLTGILKALLKLYQIVLHFKMPFYLNLILLR